MPQAPVHDTLATLDSALASGAAVLVPNHRASQQLQDAWNRRQIRATGNPVLALPAIRAIDPWLDHIWQQLALLQASPVLGWHILQPVQELLLWRQVIANSPAGATLLNLDGTASSVRNAWRLLQQHRITPAELRSELSFARLPGELPDDRMIFQEWLTAFLALCKRRQLLTFGDVLNTMLAWSDDDPAALRGVLPSALLLKGFDEPPPLYRDLLAAFEGIGIAVTVCAGPAEQPAVRVQEFTDVSAECRAAAEWARQVVTADPAASVGIICPDLQNLHPALTRSFMQTFGGALHPQLLALPDLRPLAEQPFIATALQLLELHQDSCDTLLLCQLLRSPWLIAAEEEADARARLELRLRNRGEQRTSLATLRSDCLQEGKRWYCPRLGAALLEAAAGQYLKQRDMQPMLNWLELFRRQWTTLLDHARLPATGNVALATAWEQLQDRIAQSAFLYPAGRIHAALTLVQSSAREGTLPVPGGAAQVQIVTPVESAGLQFTHLWCMQMVETQWPEQRAPNPWLPLTLQKTRELPGADPQLLLQRSRQLLAKLLAATTTMVVFSHSQFDKDLPQRPSQLMPAQAASPSASLAADSHEAPAALHPALQHFPGADTVPVPDVTLLAMPDTSLRQSPGALLADQASCPFRGFAIHRLGAEELRELSYGLPPIATGNLVHRTLEHFWDTLRSSRQLQDSSAAEITLAIVNAVGTALRETAYKYPHTMTPRYQEVARAHLIRLMHAWLEEEQRRGSFNVVASEQSLQWRFANLELRLRIDRIDRAEDGTSVVIDYKTGRLGAVDWEAQRQDNPQLMLYQQAVAQNGLHAPVSAVLHARVNLEEVKYSGIGADSTVLPEIVFSANRYVSSASWDELLQHWQRNLEQLAQEFLDGHVAVRPKSPRSCDYCHLGSFCRIAELGSAR